MRRRARAETTGPPHLTRHWHTPLGVTILHTRLAQESVHLATAPGPFPRRDAGVWVRAGSGCQSGGVGGWGVLVRADMTGGKEECAWAFSLKTDLAGNMPETTTFSSTFLICEGRRRNT